MQRITRKDLDYKAQYLNRLTGSPQEHEAGSFYIYGAYGGYCLRRVAAGGGSNDVLGVGFVTPRYLHDCMNSYAKGLELGLEMNGEEK